MFELFATIDPMAALLGSLWLFAAGMFPAGFMLGSSCSPCCEPCSACTQGSLPETITATLDGFTDYEKQYLTNLTFSACYGSGAAGRVETPGHVTPGTDPIPDRGPVGSVSLSNGGSGYAKLGRTAPTVTVTGTSGSGSGATFNVTLASSKDSCGLDRWAVSKVTRTGGSGYQTGDVLTFAIAEGDTQEIAAAATIGGTTYAEPTLTATAPGGTGGVLSINGYTKLVGGPPFGGYYVPAGITVTSGGSGYTDNAQVTLSLGTDDEWAPGSGAPDITIRTKIDPPGDDWTLTAYSADGMDLSAGVGLALSITLTPIEGVDGFFEATAVTITNGGTGYQVGEFIVATVPPDGDFGETALTITDVDQDGAVTGLLIDYPGQHQGVDTGVISSVVISSNRPARKAITEDVSVSNGGVYYREDASLPPYVATVTVGVNQAAPSQGSGASISATVGSDPANAETFGKITGLTINGGGDGYLAWEWTTNDCCGHYLNGKSIVLKRFKDSNAAACDAATLDFFGQYNILFSPEGGESYSVPSRCVYTTQFCGGWTSPFIAGPVWDKQPINDKLQLYVGFRGEGQRPVIKLGSFCHGGLLNNSSSLGVACLQDWIADEPIESCSQFSFSASPSGRPSVTVNSGGTYDPEWRFSGCGTDSNSQCPSCNVCCQGDEEVPEEIEVVVTDEWTTNRPDSGRMPDFAGTYVATGGPNSWSFSGVPPGFTAVSGSLGINPCHDGTMPLYVTANRGSCKTCIKKCRVWISGMTFQWYNQFGVFIQRRIAQLPPTDDCGDCESTPVCSPSGKSFSLNNADPATTGYAYADGVHTATVTIQ